MKSIAALTLATLAVILCGCTSAPVYGPDGGEFATPPPKASP